LEILGYFRKKRLCCILSDCCSCNARRTALSRKY